MSDISRLDRIEPAIENFQTAVHGAFEVQQQQIGELTAAQTESARQLSELARQLNQLSASVATHEKSIADLKDTVASVVREWQAYLRRVPPQ